MAFTEFVCRSGGSNMNGGCLNSNLEPATTPVYSFTNGGWATGTPNVYTPTSGNPSLTVTVGDWASVFVDGATTPVYIGRVTAVSTTTISISATAKSGTAPTTAGTGISINVGGAWAGPSGSVAFPFNFVDTAIASSGGLKPRVNFKNNQTHNITAQINVSGAGPLRYQGYTTTFGDGGRTTIDGGTTGASYSPLNVANQSSIIYADFIFQNNGATGSANGPTCTNTNSSTVFYRCVSKNMRGSGFGTGGNSQILWVECEAYNCLAHGFDASNGGVLPMAVRCIAHDNTAGHGFNGLVVVIDCIADTNAGRGFNITSTLNVVLNCDSYGNTQHGFCNGIGGAGLIYLENSNAVKNGQYGVNLNDGQTSQAILNNCGFGSGTAFNTSGKIAAPSLGSYEEVASVTYAGDATPWVDPANGDFRINLAAAKTTGRGNFLQTASGYAGTIAYPDIGAAMATRPRGIMKARTSIWSAQTLTAGGGNTTSTANDISQGYGAHINIKITNGATGPTIPAQVQVQVANDSSGTIWTNYGGPLQAGVTASEVGYWTVQIPPGLSAVRLVAGSNTAQNVTIDADISAITAV